MAPAAFSTTEAQKALVKLGWPLKIDGKLGSQTRFAIQCFQEADTRARLVADGVAGPLTSAAMSAAIADDGRASPHFRFWEFTSKGNGWIRVARELIEGLEAIRDEVGRPVAVISGYRDPDYNARIPGAAKNSRHMRGEACDIGEWLGLSEFDARRLRKFSGLGVLSRSNPRVLHVDVGGIPAGSPREGRGSTANPSIWYYS